MALPTLLSKSQINTFEFYWEGRLRRGMSISGRLYALLSDFSHEDRTLAYEKGCQLAQAADDVVLTASSDLNPQYQLWLRLASENRRWLEDSDDGSCLDAEQASKVFDGVPPMSVPIPVAGNKSVSKKFSCPSIVPSSAMQYAVA